MTAAEKVKRSFGKSARDYARYADLQRDVSDYLTRKFAPNPGAGKILDIGCGAGFTALSAQSAWPGSSVTGMDLAHPMAVEAKRNGVRDVATADAVSLPFKRGVFDAAISSLAFQWVGESEVGLYRGILDVLSDGGWLCCSLMTEGTLAELRRAYDEALIYCTGKSAVFPKFPSERETVGRLGEAGFTSIRSELRTVERQYENVGELFRVLRGIGASAPMRPANPPRRDVLQKTVDIYPASGGMICATYEVCYFYGEKK